MSPVDLSQRRGGGRSGGNAGKRANLLLGLHDGFGDVLGFALAENFFGFAFHARENYESGGAHIEQVFPTELDALRANKDNTDPTRRVRFLPYGIAVSVLDTAHEDSSHEDTDQTPQ